MQRALSVILTGCIMVISSCTESQDSVAPGEGCGNVTTSFNEHIVRPPIFKDLIEDLIDTSASLSPYDTPEFKDRVVSLMMAGYGREESEEYQYGYYDFELEKYPLLTHSCEFEADTDFVLLTYYPFGAKVLPDGSKEPAKINTGGPKQNFYVGYVKSLDEVYLLSDGFGPSIEEVFNRMQIESGGSPHLREICKAALLARLKGCRGELIAVIDSYDDIRVWIDRWSLKSSEYLPRDWLARNALFTFFPSRDSIYVKCRDCMLIAHTSWESKYGSDCQITPPTVVHEGDSTTVVLTVHLVKLALMEGVVTWQVVFDNSGAVLSMRIIDYPCSQ
jgi:hypothetical protein